MQDFVDEKTEKKSSAKYGSGRDQGNGSGELGGLCIQCSNQESLYVLVVVLSIIVQGMPRKNTGHYKKQCKTLKKLVEKIERKKSV